MAPRGPLGTLVHPRPRPRSSAPAALSPLLHLAGSPPPAFPACPPVARLCCSALPSGQVALTLHVTPRDGPRPAPPQPHAGTVGPHQSPAVCRPSRHFHLYGPEPSGAAAARLVLALSQHAPPGRLARAGYWPRAACVPGGRGLCTRGAPGSSASLWLHAPAWRLRPAGIRRQQPGLHPAGRAHTWSAPAPESVTYFYLKKESINHLQGCHQPL